MLFGSVLFIVAPCILKIHWVLHTNECTNYILYICLKCYIKTLKTSSGSTYCSLLKLRVKIVNMSLYLSVMWQHILCLCMRCFQCRGVRRLRLCTPLHWKQRIHKHTICCHITDKYNDIFTILTCNFSKEQCKLPENDIRIETCRSILSVLM